MKFWISAALGMAVMGLAACERTSDTAKVEIVPPRGSEPVAYCKRDNLDLTVTFASTGNRPSIPGMEVKVTFFTDPATFETQQLLSVPPGQTADLAFTIPSACFSPD